MVFTCLDLKGRSHFKFWLVYHKIKFEVPGPYNMMLQITSMVAMSIAATRIHRHLVDFASKSVDIPSKLDDVRSGCTPPRTSLSVPQNHIRIGVTVAIPMTYEHHQTQSLSQSGSFMGSEEQLHDKPAGVGLNDDVENLKSA